MVNSFLTCQFQLLKLLILSQLRTVFILTPNCRDLFFNLSKSNINFGNCQFCLDSQYLTSTENRFWSRLSIPPCLITECGVTNHNWRMIILQQHRHDQQWLPQLALQCHHEEVFPATGEFDGWPLQVPSSHFPKAKMLRTVGMQRGVKDQLSSNSHLIPWPGREVLGE